MKTIALALNHKEIRENFRDLNIGKKFPGAGFLPHLAKLCDMNEIAITGRMEIPNSDTVILQEELNGDGLKLLQMGAKPQVLFCMESKMYAPQFYDALPQMKKLFKYQILFDGGTHEMKFPSYDLVDLKRKTPAFHERKAICMISSNKQWWAMSYVNPNLYNSPSWCEAIRNELHTERLRAIEQNPGMDLYGRGWDNLTNIPPHWAFLIPQIKQMWKGECLDKLETLEQYQFAYAYENTRLPGYRTEKVIDCRIARTIVANYNHNRDFTLENGEYSNEAFAKQVFELLVE